MARALTRMVIALMLLVVMSSRGYGSSETAYLMVTTEVVPVLSSSVTHYSPSLVVTAEDLRRGYVDVPRGSVVSVMTNSRTYHLFFESMGSPAREVWVTVEGRTVILPGGSGMIEETGKGVNVTERKELGFRFVLLPDAAPGRYPWPLSITVAN